MKSIRTKMLYASLSAVIAITIIVGGMGVYTASVLSGKESEIALSLMCAEKEKALANIFDSVERAVQIVYNQAVSELHTSDRDGLNEENIEEYTEHLYGLFSNVAGTLEDTVAYYIRYNPEIAGPKAGFFWSKESGGTEFQQVPNTDISAYDENDVERVGWYYKPVNAGRPIWISPYENRNSGIFMCSYVVPFYDEGNLVGVIGMDIDIAHIIEMVNASDVYESSYAYLIDKHEKVVVHKDYETGDNKPEKADDELEYRILLENELTLVMTVERDEVYELRNQLIVVTLLGAAIVMLINGTIVVLITNRITKPIIALSKAVKGLEKGEYQIELDTKSKDEVGILTRSFMDTSHYLKKYTDYINSLAYKDALTGVKNNTSYEEAVKALKQKMELGYHDFGVAVFDANGLKQVNDEYGHAAGNALIIESANLICSVFSHSPVFRIGGDEFAVILENADFRDRERLLERLEEEMAHTYCESEGVRIPVSLAKGMAVCEPDKDKNFNSIFKRADDAMYVNKAWMKAEK